MIGLAATRLLDWWWLDSVAALALIPFIIKEAQRAISSEPCSGCDDLNSRSSSLAKKEAANRDDVADVDLNYR